MPLKENSYRNYRFQLQKHWRKCQKRDSGYWNEPQKL